MTNASMKKPKAKANSNKKTGILSVLDLSLNAYASKPSTLRRHVINANVMMLRN